jgi:hypothetical protein
MDPELMMSTLELVVEMTRVNSNTIPGGHASFDAGKDITVMVRRFSITDSLDQMFRIGQMDLFDLENYRSTGSLTGNEIITVSYKNLITESKSKHKQIRFRIFNVQEVPKNPADDTKDKVLRLSLIEFPIFDFLGVNGVYKTYPVDPKNAPVNRISSIIQDILASNPDVQKWCDFDIVATPEKELNFWVPNWTPMKTISYLKKFAMDDEKRYPFYVFKTDNNFTSGDSTKPRLVFKSIYRMVDDTTKVRKYNTSIEFTAKKSSVRSAENGIASYASDDQPYSMLDTLSEYKFNYFDSSRMMGGLQSGNTDFTFDYFKDNMYISSDYQDYITKKYKSLDPYRSHPMKYGNMWSKTITSPWTQDVAKHMLQNEDFVTFAKNSLMGGMWCEANTRLYEQRKPGERADLVFNLFREDKPDELDLMMSGTWITWSVTDYYEGGRCMSKVRFVKDSYFQATKDFKQGQTLGTTAPNPNSQ